MSTDYNVDALTTAPSRRLESIFNNITLVHVRELGLDMTSCTCRSFVVKNSS